MEYFYIYNLMVHQCDLSRNHIEASILLMYQKLLSISDYASRYQAARNILQFLGKPLADHRRSKKLGGPSSYQQVRDHPVDNPVRLQ